MARNKEFDIEQVIDIAVKVFREKGYSGTTTDDLRLAMGIGRQSFYDSFKGKKELYRLALRRYNQSRVDEFRTASQKRKSPMKSIEALMLNIVKESVEDPIRSCLGIYSVCEFGTSDAEISSINAGASALFETTLIELIREGQESREIRADLKISHTAQYILTVLSGLKLSAHGGMPLTALNKIVDVTLSGLKPV